MQKLALALDVDPSELIQPVPVNRSNRAKTADKETFDYAKSPVGPKLLATPFQEGFENRRGDLSPVLIDYRWNEGSTVRRWFVEPKKVEMSGIVFKPRAAD